MLLELEGFTQDFVHVERGRVVHCLGNVKFFGILNANLVKIVVLNDDLRSKFFFVENPSTSKS